MEQNNFLNARRNLYVGMKAQRDEGGQKVWLGDNAGGGAVMLWSNSCGCVGVWISTGLS
jgi:hypothetical protein